MLHRWRREPREDIRPPAKCRATLPAPLPEPRTRRTQWRKSLREHAGKIELWRRDARSIFAFPHFPETIRIPVRLSIMQSLWQDARYGFRGLRGNPGFSTLAVVTLPPGIGTGTTMFSVIKNVLLSPFPYKD